MANTQPTQQHNSGFVSNRTIWPKAKANLVWWPFQKTAYIRNTCAKQCLIVIYTVEKPSVIQYLNQIKQDWYHANTSQDENANKRNLAWVLTRVLSTKLWYINWLQYGLHIHEASTTNDVKSWSGVQCCNIWFSDLHENKGTKEIQWRHPEELMTQ